MSVGKLLCNQFPVFFSVVFFYIHFFFLQKPKKITAWVSSFCFFPVYSSQISVCQKLVSVYAKKKKTLCKSTCTACGTCSDQLCRIFYIAVYNKIAQPFGDVKTLWFKMKEWVLPHPVLANSSIVVPRTHTHPHAPHTHTHTPPTHTPTEPCKSIHTLWNFSHVVTQTTTM